ncbi:hypothetical protein CPC08DRAFT_605507, partial [Agrocybe pediades]
PFMQSVGLVGKESVVVELTGVFDDGAMINAIDASAFDGLKDRLCPLVPSGRRMRMADGRLVPSLGVWEGDVSLGGVGGVGGRAKFEVFHSGGAWSLLFGKPLLRSFRATHSYDTDMVEVPRADGSTLILSN